MSAVLEGSMPLPGLIGGLMIAGISGLAARATGLSRVGAPWPIASAFVVGLPAGAAVVMAWSGHIEARFPFSLAILIAGGLLVGFGTRLGSGCTSGHGVCGLSRLSPRSLIATATFMGAGIVTVATMNALGIGW
jgi:uncharacterized membrane protein YedE/YeeE